MTDLNAEATDSVFPRRFYREDGGEWEVELLSDTTNRQGMRTVRVRCVRELRPSPQCGSIAPGDEWDASAQRGYEAYVGWFLYEEASS